jgi:hypothetical protein
MVNISGLDKAEVLLALHGASRAQGMSFLNLHTPTIEECRDWLAQGSYVDYFAGKVIKCDLSKDEFDPRGFDRDNGEGSAESAIKKMRQKVAAK